MVESDSYGSDHFPIVLKINISLPNALPTGILVGLTGCNSFIYVKKNLHWTR